YALVESVRTEAGPRQHVVAHLGELNHDQELRWQRTVVFHNRQGDPQQLRLFPDDEHVSTPDDPHVVRIRLGKVGWTNPRAFGDVWLGLWLWKFLHLDAIVDRHLPQGKETVRPADIVAIEVINRLCAPCSEFALAEHWYQSTGLEDLLLYDLTSTYFEGLAEENDLARRGYSRDHRSDCKQVVLALIVTREGFPLAHLTLAGNTQDLQTVETIVTTIETRFGKSHRVWVMDRGMISAETLAFLSRGGRRYLLATRRGELASFAPHLRAGGGEHLKDNPDVEVKLLNRQRVHYLLARSRPRRQEGPWQPPPPAPGAGACPGKASEADRERSAQEPRQDPRARWSTQGPVPQGPLVRDDHRDEDRAGARALDLGSGEVPGGPGPRRGLPVAEQSRGLDR